MAAGGLMEVLRPTYLLMDHLIEVLFLEADITEVIWELLMVVLMEVPTEFPMEALMVVLMEFLMEVLMVAITVVLLGFPMWSLTGSLMEACNPGTILTI